MRHSLYTNTSMDSERIVCPVCTLYLRPGMRLKTHLASHPKQKVIEALVRMAEEPESSSVSHATGAGGIVQSSSVNSGLTGAPQQQQQQQPQQWGQSTGGIPVNATSNFTPITGNHSFIYQQFMTSSTPQPNILNLPQPYVVFNPSQLSPVTAATTSNQPYFYQHHHSAHHHHHQQVIMTTSNAAATATANSNTANVNNSISLNNSGGLSNNIVAMGNNTVGMSNNSVAMSNNSQLIPIGRTLSILPAITTNAVISDKVQSVDVDDMRDREREEEEVEEDGVIVEDYVQEEQSEEVRNVTLEEVKRLTNVMEDVNDEDMEEDKPMFVCSEDLDINCTEIVHEEQDEEQEEIEDGLVNVKSMMAAKSANSEYLKSIHTQTCCDVNNTDQDHENHNSHNNMIETIQDEDYNNDDDEDEQLHCNENDHNYDQDNEEQEYAEEDSKQFYFEAEENKFLIPPENGELTENDQEEELEEDEIDQEMEDLGGDEQDLEKEVKKQLKLNQVEMITGLSLDVDEGDFIVLRNSENSEDNEEEAIVERQHQTVSMLEMDGMNLVLSGEFSGNQIISQVDNYSDSSKPMPTSEDRPQQRLLLTTLLDSSSTASSHHTTTLPPPPRVATPAGSVRTDERMPPRGELSGPEEEEESNASDVTWAQSLQYREENGNIQDIFGSNEWNDNSNHHYSNHYSPSSPLIQPPPSSSSSSQLAADGDDVDTPTVSGYQPPPIQYKCRSCSEQFACPKERRVHQREAHALVTSGELSQSQSQEGTGEIGGIGTRTGDDVMRTRIRLRIGAVGTTGLVVGDGIKRDAGVKKLVIKPKRIVKLAEVKIEPTFDNVFTNRLKLEVDTHELNLDSQQLKNEPSIPSTASNLSAECKASASTTVCLLCDALFADSASLKQHQRTVHNVCPGKYQCGMCAVTFSTEVQYCEHLKIHPLECRICGRYFFRKSNLQLHMKRHMGIKPFKCTVCEKAFLIKQKLDEHMYTHTGENPIKCNLCEESFRRHSNLVQHRNKYHLNIKPKVKDFICHCGEIFHTRKKLAWHEEVHEVKPKACAHCAEKFVHQASLTRHMRRAHNDRFVPPKGEIDRTDENVPCPICNQIFLRSSLDVHVKNHSGTRPYSCTICSKDFTTKWNLKLHRWTHASRTSKPFKCDQCRGAFIRESDYTAHMNAHKALRPFTCNYCGAQFIRKYNCQRHVKEHEKDKTYSCQICNKTFHRSYYLKDHMRVHSGARPFSCHICGKTSSTKSNHNKHVRIHHAREPVTTEN